MWKQLIVDGGEPSFAHDPILLIALSTANPQFVLLYSQARELANFLLKKFEFGKFASLYASSMPPAIEINRDGTIELVGVNFYNRFNGKRDVILLAGHSSPLGEEYEFGHEVLSFAKRIGVKEMVSVGARWSEEPIPPLEKPKVLGFSSDEGGVAKLKEMGVEIQKDESAYYFANVIVAMASNYGMSGYKLSVNHGEPAPHPRGLIALSEVLSKMFGENIDTRDLEGQANDLEKVIRNTKYEGLGTEGEPMGTMQKGDIYR
jgi:proteasome assembly chaperone (PAC2) family protein